MALLEAVAFLLFLLCSHVKSFSNVPIKHQFSAIAPRLTSTELYGVRSFLKNKFSSDSSNDELHSICIIGGGVSGLTSAITAAQELVNETDTNIVLLEASPTLGGRVKTDVTVDGFTLDRGFAVFIENYPVVMELAKQGILDIDALELGKFTPGSLVKLEGSSALARVGDPIRDSAEVFNALFSQVGTLSDKANLARLVLYTYQTSVDEIFREAETDALTCLESRWGFEQDIIDKFFKPFMEGIYLAPLTDQSSRMFHFIFKMFSEGVASLPSGGIAAVGKQLADKAKQEGVELCCGEAVGSIYQEKDGTFRINASNGKMLLRAKSVVLAADGSATQKLLSTIDGFQMLESLPETSQREVACLYYAFKTPIPVHERMLILSGRAEKRGTKRCPINNVCFPSVINKSYAPSGSNLCSVTILSKALEQYKGEPEELEIAVRQELCTWFPDHAEEIQKDWEMKSFYVIPNAQPAQFGEPFPANVNGGRNCATYRDMELPEGLVVCGDFMATATLNGALESGINAGKAAAISSQRRIISSAKPKEPTKRVLDKESISRWMSR